MLVKFFSDKRGGGTASIDYLLNNRVKNGTARVLQGSEAVTRGLIESMTQKHKTCVGVLSFEEVNIDENLKFEIMKSFETALLTDEMEGRYNMLWVEHTDKGRLELNFVIPKIDLKTSKAFNPYYYMNDFKRVDFWKDYTNLKYKFSDPNNPTKAQTISGHSKNKTFNDYETLDKTLHDLVFSKQITSRDELISYISENQIAEVTRAGENYISLKLPDSKKAKKFKGGIYESEFDFRNIKEFGERVAERARAYDERDVSEELKRLEEELRSRIAKRANEYREKIRKSKNDSNSNYNRNDDVIRNVNDNEILLRSENDGARELINARKRRIDEQTRELDERQNNAINYDRESAERKRRIDETNRLIEGTVKYTERMQQRIGNLREQFERFLARFREFRKKYLKFLQDQESQKEAEYQEIDEKIENFFNSLKKPKMRYRKK